MKKFLNRMSDGGFAFEVFGVMILLFFLIGLICVVVEVKNHPERYPQQVRITQVIN